jgi:hypothetical protein
MKNFAKAFSRILPEEDSLMSGFANICINGSKEAQIKANGK